MVFSTITFLFYFLPVVLTLYVAIPRARNGLLLAASLLFYSWGETTYALLLVGSILLNYIFGLTVAGPGARQRRWALPGGIICNLALLGFFKYARFLGEALNPLLYRMGVPVVAVPEIHLPLGISFFTFQAMSYLIDVYRGASPVEKNPLRLGLYISMFPQLVAGPIVRFHTIRDELYSRTVTQDRFVRGIRCFAVGLGQKILIANTVAVGADGVFNLPVAELHAAACWAGALLYALQIYFDFAGYSNMAIGLGHMLGFHFPRNFNYPYAAQSVTEFWQRWHITLSTWFRDYLYIPLGGNRKGRIRTYANLLVVFFLCGLWHGAGWTFVLWGLFHGLFLVLERVGLRSAMKRTWRPVRHVYTMGVVVLGWVLFRADNLHHAARFAGRMFGYSSGDPRVYPLAAFLPGDVLLASAVGIVAALPLGRFVAGRASRWVGAQEQNCVLRRALQDVVFVLAVTMIFVGCAMCLAAGVHNPFIYFRF